MNQYRTFAGPFAKVFLGGVFVYQVLYWTWLKLEMDETRVEKNGKTKTLKELTSKFLRVLIIFTEQVAVLEKQAREMAQSQPKK